MMNTQYLCKNLKGLNFVSKESKMNNERLFVRIFRSHTIGGAIYFSPALRKALGNPEKVEMKISLDKKHLIIKAGRDYSWKDVYLSCNNYKIAYKTMIVDAIIDAFDLPCQSVVSLVFDGVFIKNYKNETYAIILIK